MLQINGLLIPEQFKNPLTIYKSDIVRSPAHLRVVKSNPCSIHKNGVHCNGMGYPIDPHHLMRQGGHATALKESDEWVVPLCRFHHNEVTIVGNEENFWLKWDMCYEEAEYIAIDFSLSSVDNAIVEKMVANLRGMGYADNDIAFMRKPEWV